MAKETKQETNFAELPQHLQAASGNAESHVAEEAPVKKSAPISKGDLIDKVNVLAAEAADLLVQVRNSGFKPEKEDEEPSIKGHALDAVMEAERAIRQAAGQLQRTLEM